jgi:hypothetical protein
MAIRVRYYVCATDESAPREVRPGKFVTDKRPYIERALRDAGVGGVVTHPESGREMGRWAYSSIYHPPTGYYLCVVRGDDLTHNTLDADAEVVALGDFTDGTELDFGTIHGKLAAQMFNSLPPGIRGRVRQIVRDRGGVEPDNSDPMDVVLDRVGRTFQAPADFRQLRMRLR